MNLILHLPTEALERITVIDLTQFLAERGLFTRAKVTPDLMTITAKVADPPSDYPIPPARTAGFSAGQIRRNLEDFTISVAATPRVPPAGYDDPEAV